MGFLASLFSGLGGWLLKGPLDRALDTVDKSIDNQTEREKVRGDVTKSYLEAQTRVLTGPGWWFPLFFIAPLGVWFSSVLIYSVLWCSSCAFPQPWTIAALPKPLDEWAGIIIGSLFIYAGGKDIASRWRK